MEQLNHPLNYFTQYNHITVEERGFDYAITRLDIHQDSLNPHGMVHGGCIYTLADNACGTAVHGDGRSYVTQNGTLHFIANQGSGILRATAKVRHRGKRTCVIAVEIVGDNDRLIATGEFSFFCLSAT